MAITISLLALLATFYQLYLQRVHNEKSLKPLVQIDLLDRDRLLYVHIQNNGVGPLIVEKLTFVKDDKHYDKIEQCLSLSPRSYQHITVSDSVQKVVLAGAYLEVFAKQFSEDMQDQMDDVRQQLASLKIKVESRDIYNNKMTVERDLLWFIRHNII